MIKLNINVSKIPKERLHKGVKGTYMDAILIERPDDYGNDGFISMDTTKEERAAGVKGAIIGNWKTLGQPKEQRRAAPSASRPVPPQASSNDDDSDPIPF